MNSEETNGREPRRDVLVVGGSAGAIEAIQALLRGLPDDLGAAVFVVIHIPEHRGSVLPSILQRSTSLDVQHAYNGAPVRTGQVRVAPPGYHMLLRDGLVILDRGPRENHERPSVDGLFRSAARTFESRVAGVVLSGNSDDGLAGMQAISRAGGIIAVQDPSDAAFPSMPQAVCEHMDVDMAAPAEALGRMLSRVLPKRRTKHEELSGRISQEAEVSSMNPLQSPPPGRPSTFSCPDCNGVLWEHQDGKLQRYQCIVGHAYSAEAVMEQKSDELESTLWAALRALEENAGLSERMERRAVERDSLQVARRFAERRWEFERAAARLRELLVPGGGIAVPETAETPG